MADSPTSAPKTLLLPVCINGLWGYVSVHGELVVPCVYEHVSDFSDNRAILFLERDTETFQRNKIAIVDDALTCVGVVTCQYWGSYSEGLLAFEIDNKWGYLDARAGEVIAPTFSCARQFFNGLATAEMGLGKWGVINIRGEWVVPPKYRSLWSFGINEQVTAFSSDNGKWGLVDRTGVEVVREQFAYLGVTKNGCTQAGIQHSDDSVEYGVINPAGDWLVAPQFDDCGAIFGEGSWGASHNGKWGVLDLGGEWIITPQFTYADGFYDGLSRVYVGGTYDGSDVSGGKFGFVNRAGEFVIKPRFDSAVSFKNGVTRVEMKPGDPDDDDWPWGYIDLKGEWIWNPSR